MVRCVCVCGVIVLHPEGILPFDRRTAPTIMWMMMYTFITQHIGIVFRLPTVHAAEVIFYSIFEAAQMIVFFD